MNIRIKRDGNTIIVDETTVIQTGDQLNIDSESVQLEIKVDGADVILVDSTGQIWQRLEDALSLVESGEITVFLDGAQWQGSEDEDEAENFAQLLNELEVTGAGGGPLAGELSSSGTTHPGADTGGSSDTGGGFSGSSQRTGSSGRTAGSSGGGGGGTNDIFSSSSAGAGGAGTSIPLIVAASNGVSVGGSAEPGSTVNILLNGEVTPSATVIAAVDGLWSHTFASPLAHEAVVQVQASSSSQGNYGSASITVDALAEALSVSLESDTGISANDGVTNDSTLVVGNRESGAQVEYLNSVGEWVSSYQAVEGQNTVQVRQVDALGNISEVRQISFVLDRELQQPTVSLRNDSGQNSSDGLSNEVDLVLSSNEQVSVEYRHDNGSWSSSFVPIEGQNTVSIRQTDVAGNQTVSEFSYTLDTIIAVPTVAVLNGSGGFSKDGLLDITGLEEGARVEYSQDGFSWAANSPTFSEGDNTVYVRQIDLAGNVSANSAALNFILDNTPPSAPTLSVVAGQVISGTAEANSTVELDFSGNGVADRTVAVDSSGSWTITNSTILAHGSTVSATVKDTAGNVSSSSAVVVDSEAPSISFAPAANSSNGGAVTVVMNISGAEGEPNLDSLLTAIKGQLLNGTIPGAITGSGGVYQFEVIPNGQGDVTFNAPAGLLGDQAGNSSSASATVSIRYDIEKPIVSLSDVPDAVNADAFTITMTLTGVETAPNLDDLKSQLNAVNDSLEVESISLQSTGVYRLNLVGLSDPVQLTVPVNFVSDDAGNNSDGVESKEIVFDNVVPEAITVSNINGVEAFGLAEANSRLVVDVNGDGNADYETVVAANGQWRFDFNPALAHNSNVELYAVDAAGNKSPIYSTVVDAEIPVATLTPETSISNDDSFEVTLTVSGWDGVLTNSEIQNALNISFVNASVSQVVGSNGSYTLTVQPTGGKISLQVPESLFVDTSNNANSATAIVTVAYDIDAPTAVFGAVPELINAEAFEVELTLAGATDLPSVADIKTALSTGNSGITVDSVVDNGSGSYTVTFIAASDDIALVVPEGLLTDQAGNDSVASNTITISFDGVAPNSPVLNASDGNRISGTAEANTTIDIDINNNGNVDYTVTANASGNWFQELTTQLSHDTVVSATATDEAGNKGVAGQVTVDSEIPVAVLTTDTTVINNDNFEVTLTVTGWDGTLDNSDIQSALTDSFVNASVTAITGSAGSYTLTVTPSGDGEISLQVPAGLFVDTTSNANLDSSVTPVSYDVEAPTAVFGSVPTLINAGAFEVELTLAGATNLPSDDDIKAALATANSGITVDFVVASGGGKYAVTFSAASDDLVLNVPEGLLTDPAGNDSVASSTGTISFDGVAPGAPVLNASDGNRISGTSEANATINIDVNNNGEVDYTVTADGSGNWAQDITNQLSHNTVVSATATDEAGNKGVAGQVTVDSEIPVAVLTTDTTVINEDSFEVTLTVTGWDGTLENSDIQTALTNSFTNASVTSINGSAGNYTLTVTPSGDGEISLQVPVGLFVDTTSNANLASSITPVNYDVEAPAAVFGDAPVSINAEAFEVELTLAGATDLPSVAGIKSALTTGNSDVTVDSVVASGSGKYTVTFSAASDDVVLNVPEGLLTDQAGNDSVASNTATISFDGVAPTAPVLNASDGNRISGTSEANATINIDVNNNGEVDYTVTADDSGNWAQELSSQLSHDTVVTATATDEAGNTGAAGQVTVDSEIPVAVLATDTSVINNDSFEVTLTVTAWDGTLDNSDIQSALTDSFVNASVTAITGSAGSYTLTVTPSGDGEISLQVPAGLFVDTTSNANLASSITPVNYDVEAPTAVFGTVPALINAEAFDVELTLAGATDLPSVDDLKAALITGNPDITVDSVVVSGGGKYTVTFSAASDDVALTVPEGLVTDQAGNSSVASSTATISFDGVAPGAPVLDASDGNRISGTSEANATIEIDINNDGEVDYTVTADGSGNWAQELTSQLSHNTVVSATATDEAGNKGTAGQVIVDSEIPVAVLTTDTTVINDDSFEVTLTVTGWDGTLENSAIEAALNKSFVNASVTVVSGSAGNYTLSVTPTGGQISLQVPADLFVDTTSNANLASSVTPVNYDVEAPTAMFGTVPALINAEAFDIELTLAGATDLPSVDDIKAALITGNPDITVDSVVANGSGKYTVTFSAASDDVVLTVPEGLVTDQAGNDSVVSNTATISFDGVAPNAPVLNASDGNRISGTAEANATIEIDINNDGEVDYTVTADGSGNWAQELTSQLSHDTVVSATATDEAGNKGVAGQVTVDSEIPVAVLTTETTVINNESFEVTLTVTGWDGTLNNSDIQTALTNNFTNASVTTINGSAGSYILTVTPSGDGEISLQVPAGLFVDTTSNANLASSITPVNYDIEAPTAVFGTVPALINTEAFDVELTLAGATDLPSVADIKAALITGNPDITVDSVVANGSGKYTVTFSAASDDVVLNIPAGLLTDQAGNDSVASNTATISFDGVAPTAPVLNASDGNRISGTSEANATIKIDINNDGSVEYTVVADGSGNWAQELSSQLSHDTVVSATATDEAGNKGTAGQVTVDSEIPVAVLTTDTTVINDDSFQVTLTVTGWDGVLSTVDLTAALNTEFVNALVTGVVDNGNSYTLTVRPSGEEIHLRVPGGVFQDSTGNVNLATVTTTVSYDIEAPTAVFGAVPALINAEAFEVELTLAGATDLPSVADIKTALSAANSDITVDSVVANGSGSYAVTFSAASIDVALTIPVGLLTDQAGNVNIGSSTTTISFDGRAPDAPTISASDGSRLTGTAEANARIDIDIDNNGSVEHTVTADNSGNWALDLSSSPLTHNTEVSVVATDEANNTSTESTVTVDSEGPVGVYSDIPTAINNRDFTVTLTVTGLDSEPDLESIKTTLNITVGNAVVTEITGSNGSYEVTISPSGEGDVRLYGPAGLFSDNNGNASVDFDPFQVTYDTRPPAATFGNLPIAIGDYEFQVELDLDGTDVFPTLLELEELLGQANSPLVVVSVVDNGFSHYIVTFDGATEAVTLKVPENLLVDSAGNFSLASQTSEITFQDSLPPLTVDLTIDNVVLQTGVDGLVTVTFNRAVTGLELGDFEVINGTATLTDLQEVSAGVYTFVANATTADDITIQLKPGAAVDERDELSPADELILDVRAELIPPTINNLSMTGPAAAGDAHIINVGFSEDIDGFTMDDIDINQGDLSNFIKVDAHTYTVEYRPVTYGDSALILNIDEGTLVDTAGNSFDGVYGQTFSISGAEAKLSAVTVSDGGFEGFNVRTLTLAFDQAVSDFDLSDLVINNGRFLGELQTIDGGTTWTVQTQSTNSNEDVQVQLKSNSVTGSKNNTNTAYSEDFTVAEATTNQVLLSLPEIEDGVLPITVTLRFSQDTELSTEQLSLLGTANATVSDISKTNDREYQVTLTPGQAGTIQLDLVDGLVDNEATGLADIITVVADTRRPELDIFRFGDNDEYYDTAFIRFDEPVTGLSVDDFSISNAVTIGLVDNGNGNYQLQFEPLSAGDVTLTLREDAVEDRAGNGNLEVDSTVTNNSLGDYYVEVPEVSFEGPSDLPSVEFDLTVKFDRAVTGLATEDFAVANGVVTAITPINGVNGYAQEYTVTIDPAGHQTVTVSLNEDAVQTVAGTGNAIASHDVVYDGTTVRLEVTEIPESTSGEFTIKVQMLGDLSASGPRGEITSFVARAVDLVNVELIQESNTDDPTIKEFTFKPTGDGDVGFRIDGWANGIWFPYIPGSTVEYIAPPLEVEISVDDSAVQLGLDSIVTITFNRAVSDLELDDFSVSSNNATLTNLVKVSDGVYTAVLNASTEEDVTLTLRQGAAVDGNGELSPAGQLVVDVLNTPPTATFDGPDILPSIEFDLTVTFDQPVTGLGSDDFTITNGTVTSVTPINDSNGYAREYTITIDPVGDETVHLELKQDAAQTATGKGNSAGSHDVQYDATTVRLEVIEIPDSTGGEFTIKVQAKGDLSASSPWGEVTGIGVQAINLVNVEYLGYNHTSDPLTKELKFRATGDGDISFLVQGWANGIWLPNAEPSALEYIAPPFEAELSIENSAFQLNTDTLLTITFNRAVSGFDIDDIEVVAGSASLSDLQLVSSGVYTVMVNADTNAPVTLNLKADAARDENDVASPADQLIADVRSEVVAPYLDSLNLRVPDTVDGAHIMEFTFSEEVTGVNINDIHVSQGVISNFTKIDGSHYSVEYRPEVYGASALNVTIDTDNIVDLANNPMPYPPNWTTYVSGAKVKLLGVEVSDGGFEGVEARTLTFTFNQAVTGFETEDLYLQGGRLLSELVTQDGGVTWTAQAQATINYTKFYVTLDANRVDGSQNNKNEYYREILDVAAADENQVLLTVPPIGEGILPFTIVLNFTENTTLEKDQISLTGSANAQVTGMHFVGGIGYQVTITPSQAGTVIIDLEDGIVGNEATALAEIITIVNDTTRPELDLFSFLDRTNQIPDSYYDFAYVEFKEVVFGLTADDFTITNGVITGLVNKGRGYYELSFEPLGEGEVTIVMREGAATDASGNGTLEATRSITQGTLSDYYQREPEVTFESPDILPVGELELKVTFSRAITGLAEDDFNITNGSISSIRSVNGGNDYAHEYIVTIDRAEGQDVSVELSENSVQTVAGNGNPAASHTMTHDATTVRLEVIEIPETTSGEFTVKVQALGNLSASGSFGQVDNYELSVYGLKFVELVSQTTASDPTIKELVFRATGEGDVEFYFSGEANNEFFPFLGANTVEYVAIAPAPQNSIALSTEDATAIAGEEVSFTNVARNRASVSVDVKEQENDSSDNQDESTSSTLLDLTIANDYTINPGDFDLSGAGNETIKLDSESLYNASQIGSGESVLITGDQGDRVIAVGQLSKTGNSVDSEDGTNTFLEYEVQHVAANEQGAAVDYQTTLWVDQDVQVAATYRDGALNGKTLYMDGDFSHDQINKEFVDLVEFSEHQKDSFGNLVMGSGIQKLNISDSNAVVNATFNDNQDGNVKNQLVIDGDIGDVVNADGYRAVTSGTQKSGYAKLESGSGNSKATVFVDNDVSVIDDLGAPITG